MSEIRVKNAAPELIKGMQSIALEFKEATIAKALIKLIPRYFDLKKRIEEQNKEISELTILLRKHEWKESSLHQSFQQHLYFLSDNIKMLEKIQKEALMKAQQFGTKKKARKPAPVKKSKKLSPSKSKK